MLHSPLLDSVLVNGLRQFRQLLDHLRHKDIEYLFRHLGHFDNQLDNLWHMDVCDLFTDLLTNLLLGRPNAALRDHVRMVMTDDAFIATSRALSHRVCDG